MSDSPSISRYMPAVGSINKKKPIHLSVKTHFIQTRHTEPWMKLTKHNRSWLVFQQSHPYRVRCKTMLALHSAFTHCWCLTLWNNNKNSYSPVSGCIASVLYPFLSNWPQSVLQALFSPSLVFSPVQSQDAKPSWAEPCYLWWLQVWSEVPV